MSYFDSSTYQVYLGSGSNYNSDFNNNFESQPGNFGASSSVGYDFQEPSSFGGGNQGTIKLDLSRNKYPNKFHRFIEDIEVLIENLTLSNVMIVE